MVKKLLIFCLNILITMYSCTPILTYASTSQDTVFTNLNQDTNVLKVYGTISATSDTNVSMTVLNPGYSAESLDSLSDSEKRMAVNYTDSFVSKDGYYRFVYDLQGVFGIYTVIITYGTNRKMVTTFTYMNSIPNGDRMNIAYNETTSSLRIYGTLHNHADEYVNLIVLNPNYQMEDLPLMSMDEKQKAINHMEQKLITGDNYEFKYKIQGESGYYTAVIRYSGNRLLMKAFQYKDGSEQYDNGIDRYTTTRYSPWIVNYHLTSREQIAAGYKGGEAGQMMWSMGVSSSNPNCIIVGTDTGGLWKSEDGGITWRSSNSGFNVIGTNDVAFDPDNENIVYALGSTGSISYGNATENCGIYKSTDGGRTWTQLHSKYYYRQKSNKLIQFGDKDAQNRRKIYVGGHGSGPGLLVSADDGNTWESLGLDNIFIRDLIVKGNTIIVGTKTKGVMVSYDGGATWQQKNNGIGNASVTVTVDPSNDRKWICAVSNTVYKSIDAGDTWTPVSATTNSIASVRYGPANTDGTARLYMYQVNIQYPFRYSDDDGSSFIKPIIDHSYSFMKDNWGWGSEPFVIHPTDPNILWVSLDGEIYKSLDKGNTLYASSTGYSGMRANDFLFNPKNDNDIFIACIDRGIIKTDDAERGEHYPAMDYDPSEDRNNIRYHSNKTVRAVARDPKNPNRIIIVIGNWFNDCELKESIDGGLTYHSIENTQGYTTECISFNSQDTNTIYAGSLISNDDGKTWTAGDFKIYAVSPVDGNTVFGVKDGYIQKSTDAGKNWVNLGWPGGSVQRMTADLFDKNKAYVAYGDGGILMIDGMNVSQVNRGTAAIEGDSFFRIWSVDQDPKNSKHLIAGGIGAATYMPTDGLYETYDGGLTWYVVEGIPSTRDIWTVRFHPNLPRVYVGTSSGTFVYEYENYVKSDVVSSNQQCILSDGKLDIDMDIFNCTDVKTNYSLIVALFNENGTLKEIYQNEYSAFPLEKNHITYRVEIKSSSDVDRARIYIWDGYEKIIPVSENYLLFYVK